MKFKNCPYDQEIQRLIQRGAVLAGSSAEVQAHVAHCPACAERLRLAEGFRALRAQSMATAPSLPPGLVWWRAQLRRRNEAIESIGRPLLVAQVVAFAVGLLAVSSLGFAWLPLLRRSLLQYISLWESMLPQGRWLVPATVLGAAMLVATFALYFVFDRTSNER